VTESAASKPTRFEYSDLPVAIDGFTANKATHSQTHKLSESKNGKKIQFYIHSNFCSDTKPRMLTPEALKLHDGIEKKAVPENSLWQAQ